MTCALWMNTSRRRAHEYPQQMHAAHYTAAMAGMHEVEFVFEPDTEGGYHVYAPDLPGLHTEGEDLADATDNAREALALYVEWLRDEGRELRSDVIRRTLSIPA